MKFRDLRKDWLGRRAIAAVEFAIIVPFFLLPMFLGTFEIVSLYRTEAKLNAAAFNVAQMVSIMNAGSSSSNGITALPVSATGAASLADLCHGTAWGLAPLPASGITFAIAGITLESQTSSSATVDYWEQDGTLSGGTCATNTAVAIGKTNAASLTEGSGQGYAGTTTGMLEVPCDNAIIVQLSMAYPGMLGKILVNRPVLTQTAYTRWRYASPTTELQCSTSTGAACTTESYQTGTNQICNSSNKGTN